MDCQRNPKSCPLLDVSETGSSSFPKYGPDADIRTDVGEYYIYRDGEHMETMNDISELYDDQMVSFLLGCSFTFEHALLEADIPVRHIEEGHNVPMYITDIETNPAGIFRGPTTVSMRPMTMTQALKATEITTNFKAVHGAPLHIGDPAAIGIKDINTPDFGVGVTINDGEVPVFWGCGVTPQSVCLNIKPELMITHAPGYMFVTDVKDSEILY
ncbi:putative hydro-lyase [Macrococcus lamae]|uniref:Putative hydro-lyase n=1 Tax=Macrococcus lamae TaxID=198484 RepID=A0A4R6BT42_9STAP|nr:putative hydro-lyase [Macrococcus lamae]